MKIKYLLFLFILSALGVSNSGCQMNPKKQFEKLELGMDKVQVIDLMNSPQISERRASVDRWTYIFYEDSKEITKQVHFSDGKVTYLGDKPLPEISAEEQDALNEAANLELEKQTAARKLESQSLLPDYEEAVKGRNEIRYMPNFQPVQ